MKAVLHGPLGSTNLETSHFTFGSSPDNSLVIDNIKVAAHHAEIRSEDNGSSITDLGSIHGTYVNGERLDFNSPRLLNPGDSITIGDSIFTYDLEESSQTEKTIPISHEREEEHEILSGEDLTTPLTTNDEDVVGKTSEDQQLIEYNPASTLPQLYVTSNEQQLDAIPFVPADFDGPIPGYMSIEQVRRRDRRFILIGVGLLVVIALGYWWLFLFQPLNTRKDA